MQTSEATEVLVHPSSGGRGNMEEIEVLQGQHHPSSAMEISGESAPPPPLETTCGNTRRGRGRPRGSKSRGGPVHRGGRSGLEAGVPEHGVMMRGEPADCNQLDLLCHETQEQYELGWPSNEGGDHILTQPAVNFLQMMRLQAPGLFASFIDIMREYERHKVGTDIVFSQVKVLFRGYPEIVHQFKEFLPNPGTVGDHSIHHQLEQFNFGVAQFCTVERVASPDEVPVANQSVLRSLQPSTFTCPQGNYYAIPVGASNGLDYEEEVSTSAHPHSGNLQMTIPAAEVAPMETGAETPSFIIQSLSHTYGHTLSEVIHERYQTEPYSSQKVMEIMQRVNGGEITTDSGWIQIQEVLGILSKGENMAEETQLNSLKSPKEQLDLDEIAFRFNLQRLKPSPRAKWESLPPVNPRIMVIKSREILKLLPSKADRNLNERNPAYSKTEESRILEQKFDKLLQREVNDSKWKLLLLNSVLSISEGDPSLKDSFADIFGKINWIEDFYDMKKGFTHGCWPDFDDVRVISKVGSYYYLAEPSTGTECSGRTALCNQVLNHELIAIAKSSTFQHTADSEYKQRMESYEDARFEFDRLVTNNAAAISVLQDVLHKMKTMNQEELDLFELDDSLGGGSSILHREAIQLVYSGNAVWVIEGLKRLPSLFVPRVLRELMHKGRDFGEVKGRWNEMLSDSMNKVREEYLQNEGGSGITDKEQYCNVLGLTSNARKYLRN